MSNKAIGIIPCRMGSSRFPGKPLHLLKGQSMVSRVVANTRKCHGLESVYVTTCDEVIADEARRLGLPVLMTSSLHVRALDRVYEAASMLGLSDDDRVVCIQGDEPLVSSEMIDGVLSALTPATPASMLLLTVESEKQLVNPDTVKAVISKHGQVVYTSRSVIPYRLDRTSQYLRVAGVFGFYYEKLKIFNETPEGPLELAEQCDSNRICDLDYHQQGVVFDGEGVYSVDSPSDVKLVERML